MTRCTHVIFVGGEAIGGWGRSASQALEGEAEETEGAARPFQTRALELHVAGYGTASGRHPEVPRGGGDLSGSFQMDEFGAPLPVLFLAEPLPFAED